MPSLAFFEVGKNYRESKIGLGFSIRLTVYIPELSGGLTVYNKQENTSYLLYVVTSNKSFMNRRKIAIQN